MVTLPSSLLTKSELVGAILALRTRIRMYARNVWQVVPQTRPSLPGIVHLSPSTALADIKQCLQPS